MLATLTKDGNASNGKSWSALAQHAYLFVQAMYLASGPYFYHRHTRRSGHHQQMACARGLPDLVLPRRTQRQHPWHHRLASSLTRNEHSKAPHSSLTGNEVFSGMVFDTASISDQN